MKKLVALGLLLCGIQAFSQTPIINYGASWKYLDNGSNAGTAWRSSAFDDSGWPSGAAQLGYGDGDEATVLSYGADAANKYITSYFRTTVTINPAGYTSFSAGVLRDDGIVVYVNGTEVYRNNMPTGTVAYNTLASAAASDDGTAIQTFSIPASAFINGNNLVAVEIHQNAGSSSDLTFDMQLTGTPAPAPAATLSPFAGSWKYRADGSNQGSAWTAVSFNDASWTSGVAPFGYGDGDEATTIPFGSNSKKKYITSYFRRAITVSNAAQYGSFTINLKRDDGAVVYVNGVERFRSNMPTGAISYTTKASGEPADDGNTIQTTSFTGGIVEGTNIIAVELHQSAANGADVSFDLQLQATTGTPVSTAALTRSPYLQMVNGSGVTLRWRTDIATDSKIEVGTAFGNYTLSATNPAPTTEHEVRINGLSADTRYYYRFGSSTQVLQAGTDNFFTTAPDAGALRKIRIAAFGDCGRNDNSFQTGTLNAYRNYVGSSPAELLLLMGDNAYDAGTDTEYSSRFFGAYGSTILKNHALFPSPGNHDYANNSTRQNDHNVPYYSVFSNPVNGECGGVASGTEAFYSFNWGNIHFLSLDSYGKENNATRLYDTLGAQVQWIKADLAANDKKWTIAYWHHPPYTMGSHNSDTETELINIRNNFIRILERYGVDMIICGHSHDYERSYLLKGYYGSEASFNAAAHTASNSSGKYNGSLNSCPYTTTSGAVAHGTVYVVAGSAGADGGIQAGYPHNALPFSIDDGGMFYLEVEQNRLDARFIRRDGTIADNFTIVKDTRKNTVYNINAGESVDLTASWIGSYNWSTGATSAGITVSPTVNTTYIVNDQYSCLADTFVVNVNGAAPRGVITVSPQNASSDIWIAPTVVKRGQPVQVRQPAARAFIVADASGQVVKQVSGSKDVKIETTSLAAGVYYIRWKDGKETKKFIVVN